MLGTMAETRKNFSTKYGEKDNELAIPEDLKSGDEYINFIKNDKKLFERAVSAEALIKAWYQQKSKPSMGTSGTNKETLTGINKLWFGVTSAKLIKGTFKFPKRRRISIPKKSGGTRPLTITDPRVKIIERALLNVLEPQWEGYTHLEVVEVSEYKPDDDSYMVVNSGRKKSRSTYYKKAVIIKRKFYPHSYGFRPNKSAHECLNNIRLWRNTTVFMLDYDIKNAYNEVNRNRLKNIITENIKDSRFWMTIDQMLKAGVVENFVMIQEEKGVAQGSVLSPFLFNVYLHELDKFIVDIQQKAALTSKEYTSGLYGNMESEKSYRKISREFGMDRWRATLEKYGTVDKVVEARRKAYKEHHDKYGRRKGIDQEIRHIHYVRYADDFLLGIVGSRAFALKVRKDINDFLRGNLHMGVKKDSLVHRNEGAVEFLGHKIRLQEYKEKHNVLPKAMRATKQHKKKVIARFSVVEKRLSRAKINHYRANVLKEVAKICHIFQLNAKKKNDVLISNIIAIKTVCEKMMKTLGISELEEFAEKLLATNQTQEADKKQINPALDRWIKIYEDEAKRLTELGSQMQRDMIAKSTAADWENKMNKSTVDELTKLQEEYVEKTMAITNKIYEESSEERKRKVAKMYRISEKNEERKEIDKKLLNLAESISAELIKKNGVCRISVNAQIKKTVDRLRLAGYIHPIKSRASGNQKLSYLRDEEIVLKYNSVIHGLLNWYSGAGNFLKIKGIAMLLRKSCVLTLANKHKKSAYWVYGKYGSEIAVQVSEKKSVELLTRHKIANFKSGFKLNEEQNYTLFWEKTNLIHRASHGLSYFEGCSVMGCSETENIEVHHIRALKRKINSNGIMSVINKKGKRVSGIAAVLTTVRRKQLPLCAKHHLEFEKGNYSQLDYGKLTKVLNSNNSEAFALPIPKEYDFLPILKGEDFTMENKIKKKGTLK